MDSLAKRVYDLIASLPPDSAEVVAGMFVNEAFHADLGDEDITKAYIDYQNANVLPHIKTALIRSYVSKRMAGEDVDAIVRIADIISKDEKQKIGFHPTKGDKPWKNERRDRLGRWARTASGALDTVDAVRSTNTDYAFVPHVQNLSRLQASADFLATKTPPGSSANLAAHTTGLLARFGIKGSRIFTPVYDRAKYRYTGTERKVDTRLSQAMLHDRQHKEHPLYGGTVDGRWKPSQTLSYFRSILPNEKMADLQRKAGHPPASQGVITDAKGQISAQMIGSGDDHFLPFSAANLGPMRHGGYIRTRTNGGLTTEDVHTGLMAGARQMTVVSHNGVFTMELDDSLRGSRRYSQTARQMSNRYGKLLDAVKNGEVHYADIDPGIRAELRANSFDDDGSFDKAKYERLITAERENPHTSAGQVRNWGMQWLDEKAEQAGYSPERTRTGDRATSISAAQQYIDKDLTSRYAVHVAERENESMGSTVWTPDDDYIRSTARAELYNDPSIAAGLIGQRREYRNHIEDLAEDYISSQQPMKLDGQGYEYAMHALQEQFPYFIKSVHYQPWSEGDVRQFATDENKSRFAGAMDRSYVMPRYNRPHEVEAGYYDSDILGMGKQPANRTRYQNAGVTRTVETGYRRSESDQKRREASRPARTTSTENGDNTPPSGGDEKKSTTPDLPKAATPSKQREIDLAYVNAMLAPGGKFSDQYDHPTLQGATLRGESIDSAKHWFDSDQAGYGVLKAKPGDYDNLSNDELHAKAKEIYDLNQRDHIRSDVSAQEAAFARGGQPVDPIKMSALELAHFSNFDDELDFGPEAKPGRSRKEYSDAFSADKGIMGLYRKKAVPELDDDEFENKTDDELVDRQVELEDAAKNGESSKISHLTHEILALLKARQLNRFYHEAPHGPVGNGNAPGIAPRQIFGGQQSMRNMANDAVKYGTFVPLGGKAVTRMGRLVPYDYSSN